MEAIIFLIGLLIGVVVGMAITNVVLHKKISGALRVDNSVPEDKPYLFLEIFKDPNRFKGKKYITLEIKFENYISR